MELKTTAQTAARLGTTRPILITLLARHPELRPATQLPSGDLLWTEEEIQRAMVHRGAKKRKKRK